MVNQFGQHIPDYPGQQPHQDQAYMRYWAQQNQRYQQQTPAQMQAQQPTSRMAEVFLATSEKSVYDFPVAAGTTVLFVASDESFIAIKEVSVAGQITISFYDKRPPAPQEKPVDLTAFVTREELERRLSDLAKKETGVEA